MNQLAVPLGAVQGSACCRQTFGDRTFNQRTASLSWTRTCWPLLQGFLPIWCKIPLTSVSLTICVSCVFRCVGCCQITLIGSHSVTALARLHYTPAPDKLSGKRCHQMRSWTPGGLTGNTVLVWTPPDLQQSSDPYVWPDPSLSCSAGDFDADQTFRLQPQQCDGEFIMEVSLSAVGFKRKNTHVLETCLKWKKKKKSKWGASSDEFDTTNWSKVAA